MAFFKAQLWRILWLFICVTLAACGGGGGGGGGDGSGGAAPPDSSGPEEPGDSEGSEESEDPEVPEEPEDPEEPDPVPAQPTEVDESNFGTYLDDARSAWQTHGSGGLDAVIAALEDEANDPRYEYDQVVEFVKNYAPYAKVLGTHNWGNISDPADPTNPVRPVSDFDHPFTLTNIHKAMASGLTGLGQTIAIYDDGFDINHPDLAGKTIDCGLSPGQHGEGEHGNCRAGSADDHGTATSVIAAGLPSQDGLMGVAPLADLVLFDWHRQPSVHLATRDAIDAGSIVQSNSWGRQLYLLGQNGCQLDAFDRLTWQCFYAELNVVRPETVWFPYDFSVEAWDDFQEQGVIVFALPNADSGLKADLYSLPGDSPHLNPELQEAWISVINARIKTDGNGIVSQAHRDSSPCNLSAPWCLVGNGHLTHAIVSNPNDPSDNPYGSGHGTSYVAPQVAGAVALLAEAFPNLGPADLTARLLASANNRWFLEVGDVGYNPLAELGERCWNELCHKYSQEWGHGIMDLEAALRPIGDLDIVNGAQLQSAARAPLSQANLTAPSGSFGALHQALSLPLTTFDALNGNFAINASGLVSEQETKSGAVSLLRRFERNTAGGSVQGIQSLDAPRLNVTKGNYAYSSTYDVSAEGVPTEFEIHYQTGHGGLRLGFGFTSSQKTTSFGGLQTIGYSVNPTSFADLLGDVAYFSMGTGVQGTELSEGEPITFTLFSFNGENASDEDGSISGLGARIGLSFNNTRLEISTTFAAEQGSYLGIDGDEDIWFGGTAKLLAGQVSLHHDLGDGLSFTARAETGTVSDGADGGRSSLISQMEDTLYTGLEIGFEQRNLFTSKDTFAVWVSQPMRVEESSLTLTLPSGRTKAGQILYENYQADLTPDARQIDIGFNYRFLSNDDLSETQFGLMQSFNHGHVAGEHSTSVAVRHVMRF